jgi:hypothetical protein
MLEPGLRCRLVRDRFIELAPVAHHPALDQPAVPVLVKRAIEGFAVEAVGVDIMQKIGGRDRRVHGIERDDDAAHARVNVDRHERFDERGCRHRGRCWDLGKDWRGHSGKQRGSKESVHHRAAA